MFEAMEKHDLVLNLHGEVPDVNVMNAEEAFLPMLKRIHQQFKNLRIVLEHCSTAAALEAVRSCGHSVAGKVFFSSFFFRAQMACGYGQYILTASAATITAHHLYLTVDDTVDPLAFCKPIAKTPEDRDALIKAVCSGDPNFFL